MSNPLWIKNWRKYIVVVCILISFVLLAYQEPMPPSEGSRQEITETPSSEVLFRLPDVRTPVPPEMLANSEQTNGLIIGGVILVLIVVGGTLGVIRRKP